MSIAGLSEARNALEKANGDLEAKIEERTAELIKINESLRREIDLREKAQLQAEVHNKRLRRIAELSMVLSGDPIDIFNHVAQIISELMNVNVVCLSEIRGDQLHYLSVYKDGEVKIDAGKCSLDITPCATVEESRDMKMYDNVAEKFPKASFLKDSNADFYCGFPSFNSEGEVIAVTCLLDDKPHDFSEEDKDLLRIFGQRIGLEMERQRHISDNKRLEEQLSQSKRIETVGKLAGGIAHDFNNILTVIIGLSENVMYELGENDHVSDEINEIMKAGLRAAELTRQLLVFSHNQKMEVQTADLNAVILNLQKMLSRTINENIELQTILDPDLDCINADIGQIEQVIMNLVINARDAMPDGGKLSIETRNVQLDDELTLKEISLKSGKYVMLTIQDTGTGIDKQTMEKIFEPYFTTKEFGKGTGLGLSTVHGIVKQSGGSISVDSEPGQGVSFKIYFPVVECQAKSDCREKEDTAFLWGSKTILIAEDYDVVRELVSRQLSGNGNRIFEAQNGIEALQVCKTIEGPIDFLVTDIMMPGLNGDKLADQLKKEYPQMKVLFMSGYSGNFIPDQRNLEEGAAFIQKPFTTVELRQKINSIFNGARTDSKKEKVC